ncbi:hypothetical protein ARMSODRAFT_1087839 [Armillaria solidipes]|uniref:Uncharacterized protein n=1 Tax=Armillaria solidipes TaxID=1076256 RepID=A0A2H3BLI1_9AGAR|nr:hypothetical protein ARMSODRAFT_1087839 [Armillaria solidipes]
MMGTLLDLINIPEFVEEHWIGVGKKYSAADDALEIQKERKQILKIPPDAFSNFPILKSLPVAEFTKRSIPPQFARRRRDIFLKEVPKCVEVLEARVSSLKPIHMGACAIILLGSGDSSYLAVGQVIAMYSKSGGKNGNHAAVTEASNVSALSYLGFQVMSVLAGSAPIADIHSKTVVLCPNDMELFLRLKGSISRIQSAVKKFNSRKKVGAGSDDEVEREA